MDKYILDANLFFNMEAALGLGNKTEAVVMKITDFAIKLKRAGRAEFFMPPRVVAEFLSFFDNKEQEFIKKLLAAVTVKSPDVNSVSFSATIFYNLISDIRNRSYKGLNLGEEEIERAAETMSGKPALGKKDFQIKIGASIKKFRERYRNATRTGFLDSVADLDLIVLAKEQAGYLISTDEGVINWGRVFGVKEMPAEAWLKRLEELLVSPPQETHQG